MLGDSVYADRPDEAHPGGQSGNTRQVKGARLEPPRVLLGLFGLSDLKPVPPSRKGFTGKGADRTSTPVPIGP